jgi:hypothetical protein
MLAPFLFAAFSPIHLQITNIEAGETVRYPLLLVRGTTDAPAILAGLGWKSVVKFPAADGKFQAAVELKPGPNMVLVASGRDTVKIKVDYVPMKTPYMVRSVYLLAKDEPSDFDGPAFMDRTQWGEKLDVALKMMQSVAAESMKEAGYGRKTFPLEFDSKGKVVVHVVRTDETGANLRAMDGNALWSRFAGELEKQFPYDVNKVCGVMAFSKWDRRSQKAFGYTALGGGGLGLFGGATMYTWPTTIAEIPKVFTDDRPVDPNLGMDDTGLRGMMWSSPATTIGAMLHEMGHTFGLPHSVDNRSAMSRGFDFLNRRFVVVEPPRKGATEGKTVGYEDATHWDPLEAARLNLSPWFQPDGYHGIRFPAALPPRVTFEGDEVVVSAPYGLGVVAAVREGKEGIFREFKGEKTVRLKRSEFGEGEGTLMATDVDGNQTEAKLP